MAFYNYVFENRQIESNQNTIVNDISIKMD